MKHYAPKAYNATYYDAQITFFVHQTAGLGLTLLISAAYDVTTMLYSKTVLS